jgi:predicted nucleic acid-binding protein
VPSITVLEVFKRVLQQRDEGAALRCVGVMQQGRVVDLDASLPLADSVVFATAQRANAELWTQDADFEGLPGVRYFPKR